MVFIALLVQKCWIWLFFYSAGFGTWNSRQRALILKQKCYLKFKCDKYRYYWVVINVSWICLGFAVDWSDKSLFDYHKNIVWKLPRGCCLCYWNTSLPVPGPAECIKIDLLSKNTVNYSRYLKLSNIIA